MKNRFKFRAWDKFYKRFWTQEEMNEAGGFYYCYGLTPNKSEFELMQCIGLKDKNGKDIYEGDILQSENKLMYPGGPRVVEWEDFGLRYTVKYEKDKDFYYHPMRGVDYKWFEIIGNIYENPELINKKEE